MRDDNRAAPGPQDSHGTGISTLPSTRNAGTEANETIPAARRTEHAGAQGVVRMRPGTATHGHDPFLTKRLAHVEWQRKRYRNIIVMSLMSIVVNVYLLHKLRPEDKLVILVSAFGTTSLLVASIAACTGLMMLQEHGIIIPFETCMLVRTYFGTGFGLALSLLSWFVWGLSQGWLLASVFFLMAVVAQAIYAGFAVLVVKDANRRWAEMQEIGSVRLVDEEQGLAA